MVGKKTRMFKFIRKTWNPVVGCLHHCYNERCWANLTAGRLRHIDRYKDGFNKPKLIEAELKKRFGKGQLVFVTDMGDLFGQWVPDEWILKVIEAMKNSPEAKFFLEPKNPRRYFDFLERLPHNVILSTTIETNRDYRLSKAPPPRERYEAMKELLWHEKHVSVEPVADFDLDVFVSWIHDIGPQRVSVGYDNYNAGFREPSLSKTLKLIDKLEEFTDVERKTLREANTVSKRDIKAKLEEIVKDLTPKEKERLYEWAVEQLEAIRGVPAKKPKFCPLLSMITAYKIEYRRCIGPRCAFYNKKLRICAICHIAAALHNLEAKERAAPR